MGEKLIKYGLRHKIAKKLLSVETTPGYWEDDFSGADVVHKLVIDNSGAGAVDSPHYGLWLVDNPYHAEYVRQTNTEDYKAHYQMPQNPFKPNELEVVKVVIEIDDQPVNVSVPTQEEYFEMAYKESEPEYYSWLISSMKQGEQFEKYTIWGLFRLLVLGLWPRKKE
jgi:hypothetical protein